MALLLLLLSFMFSIFDHSIQKREKPDRTDFVREFKDGSIKELNFYAQCTEYVSLSN